MGVRTTVRIELPHEPGEWIDVRKLSARQVRAVKAAGVGAVPLGEDDADEAQGMAMMDAYCQEAIVAWSYREDGEPLPVTPENVADLDLETESYLFETALQLQKESAEAKKSASPRPRARARG